MKEYFVIYDKNTGYMDGGCGPIDRTIDQAAIDAGDESVMLAAIGRTLAKKQTRSIIYLSTQDGFDPEKHKIVDGEIVSLTTEDISNINAKFDQEDPRIIELESRIEVLEAAK